jgi:hypothetical protein
MAGNDWRRFAMLAIIGGAFAFALHLAHATAGGLVILGFWLGDFLAESGRLRHTASAWPVLSRTLDWTRVERALADKRLD